MCGIAGFWRSGVEADLRDRWLRRMNDALAHRGPDDAGEWHDAAGVGLAQRRLAIVDLSAAGAQPMKCATGRYTITFNGEIYNHRELRGELEAQRAAPSWRGHSDTEVFLAAVSAWGIETALARSVGMWAFALWDSQERTLTLARDRFGEKPLYFYRAANAFCFASEIKSLRTQHDFPAGIDGASLGSYLRDGYVPAGVSIYRDVKKLRPGSVLTLRAVEGTQPAWTERSYWDPRKDLVQEPHEPVGSLDHAADRLQALLREAVSRQVLADVPVGAFLSGGIDSSLVVAMMKEVSSAPVKTFTIGFEDPAYDEAPYARAVASHLGTDHHEEYLSTQRVFDLIPQMPDVFDEPFGDSSQIPTLLVSAIARKHVTVSLSGDGGDELFGGYNHYRWGPPLMTAAGLVPAPLRAPFAQALRSPLGPLGIYRVDRLLALMAVRDARVGDLLNSVFPDPTTDLGFRGPAHFRSREDDPGSLDGAERLLMSDVSGFLAEDILVKLDRSAMRVALETRVPFLDHRVARFAWSLPLAYRTSRRRGKIILRHLLARHVPGQLFERPKAGFGLPLGRWFRAELRPMVEKYLVADAKRYSPWLDPVRVTRLWREHEAGRVNRQREIWTLLSLCMWLEKFA